MNADNIYNHFFFVNYPATSLGMNRAGAKIKQQQTNNIP